MRSTSEFEPILLAKGGASPHAEASFGTVDGDSNQYFFFPGPEQYNGFLGTSPNKRRYTRDFHDFVTALRPALVHVQHTLSIGVDIIRQIRNSLPEAPIVYTLHDFGHICHRDGQMVRTKDQQLCLEESPQRCHQCFPRIPTGDFFLRKRFVRYHLSLVDLFLAPSQFLRDRYLQWGIPPEKIRFEEYGRLDAPRDESAVGQGPKNRFGFFGQCTMYKGVDVVLKALKLVVEDEGRNGAALFPVPSVEPDAVNGLARHVNGGTSIHVALHAANLELQAPPYQKEIKALLEENQRHVTWIGRYEHADLPRLMANVDWVIVPSIWWENSPLVIQEAFQHGKPVICSDIGGMAEKVTDGVNGLHFRVGEPASLAQTMLTAARSPDLWHRLRSGIPPVYRMHDHMAVLTQAYQELIERRLPAE